MIFYPGYVVNIIGFATLPKDFSTTNLIGNRLVPFNKPSGRNKTIGAKDDSLRNRVYEFLWNSNGFHTIIIYNNATRVRTKLLQSKTDSGGIDILDFDEHTKIIHIDIIHRDGEGDMLYFTDGRTSPKKINITFLENGIYGVVKLAFIEAAKAPFLSPPLVVYGSDLTRNANSLRRYLVQVAARPVYDDFEKPVFFTFSKIPLPIGIYGSDNDVDSNKNNFITITVQTGDKNVKKIEIAARFNIGNAWNDAILIGVLDKEQLGIPDNVTYDYLFYNDALYPTLDPNDFELQD